VATQIFFGMFTPKLGEDEPNLTNIFFKWVGEKPPTTWRIIPVDVCIVRINPIYKP